MSFAKTYAAQTTLLDAEIITIEIDLSNGLHAFTIVGLPDKAVEESRDRVSAAIKNTGFTPPKSKNQKTVVSLAPADVKKEGPLFDLAIALAYLLAFGDITFEAGRKLFLGELALDGTLRKIRGTLPLVIAAHKAGFEEAYVPKDNAREAALVAGINVYGVDTLGAIIKHLNTKRAVERGNERETSLVQQPMTHIEYARPENIIDFDDIKGQEIAKRGLEIAAAGGHNIAMYGPPGVGKTMLARAFCNVLPRLDFDEVIEVTGIHSVAGRLVNELITYPPFRSPHHTSSYVSLVGGGSSPRPGEITLAHRGVLFLDEFPEFDRRVVEALREPLEDKVVSITRAKGSARFPANAILIAAMNPCPCGKYGSDNCLCTPSSLLRYRRKLSGPIMDRIDMWLEVSAIPQSKLGETSEGRETKTIGARVARARSVQRKRFEHTDRDVHTNSDMNSRELAHYVPLNKSSRDILNTASKRLDLSPRVYHRVIKMARTIADLSGEKDVTADDILEALSYRPRQDKW